MFIDRAGGSRPSAIPPRAERGDAAEQRACPGKQGGDSEKDVRERAHGFRVAAEELSARVVIPRSFGGNGRGVLLGPCRPGPAWYDKRWGASGHSKSRRAARPFTPSGPPPRSRSDPTPYPARVGGYMEWYGHSRFFANRGSVAYGLNDFRPYERVNVWDAGPFTPDPR